MSPDRPAAPVARRIPHSFTRHGVTIEDPYAWLRDPGYPQVTEVPNARLSQRRECLFRKRDGAASQAGRHHLRRAERPGEGRRFQRAAEERRLTATGSPSMPAAITRNGTGGRLQAGRRRDPERAGTRQGPRILSGSAALPSVPMRACSPMPPTPTAPNASCCGCAISRPAPTCPT